MSKNVVYVGVDVDDKAFHFSCIQEGGELLAKGVRASPSVGALLRGIKKVTKGKRFVVAYEASYLGFTLARELQARKCEVKVVAPTSIKRAPNERVKNDALDSLRLAEGLLRDEFSFVKVPDAVGEADRQMCRSREFLVSQRSDLKRHILSQCRLLGFAYKKETGQKSHWTLHHRNWLDAKIKEAPESMHVGLSCLLQQLESFELQIASLSSQIEHLSEQPRYKRVSAALCSFKGLSVISSMSIVTEIQDIRRFSHPKQLSAYCGLDIREYSSGGKQTQYGISKMGSRRLRTTLVEACQKFGTSKTPSKRKGACRSRTEAQVLEIADRCQARLYKKGHRLLAREKHRNKVKVACAREMIGFIWEAMRIAS